MKKKEKLPFFIKGIFVIIALFFSFGIYLSIPVLFNYNSIENTIEKKFYSDFNIDLDINGDIKYQLLPKPHLLINNSSLLINKNSKDSIFFNIKNLKIFLNTNNLYPKSKLDLEKFEIQENNFLIKKKEYISLKNYFHKSKSKPFNIKKSKIFVLDEKDETLIISPVEDIFFNTSKKDNYKKLIINGNVFDLNFKSIWKKEFVSEYNSQIEINFKEPNILIKNELNYYEKSLIEGFALINFLNQNIEVDYKFKNNKISLKSPQNNNDIRINASIELRPFYFISNINLNRQNLNFLIDELFFSIFHLKTDLIGNLNGDLNFSLTNIEHELIRDGHVNFNLAENSVNLKKVKFNLNDIGVIESKINYVLEKDEIIFNSLNTITIQNNKKFAKKFQLNPSKTSKLNKIDFKIRKNINTGLISIFDIKINQLNIFDKDKKEHMYNIRNTQELKSLVKRIIND